ncbi:MAG: DNA-binding transcriptional MerR regulator [Halocynthiibacter sp.]|jgi:MerR family redox-sensitive transcriptional activator SoxR
MQIGAVAETIGMSTSAIRYYERRGLIRSVGRISGRREFDAQTILTLRFLKLAKSAGFTLIEAQRLLKMGFGAGRPEADWSAFLSEKRTALRAQIEEAKKMDDLLAKFESCACPSLADCLTSPSDAPLQRKPA